jgi:hypothetical protein
MPFLTQPLEADPGLIKIAHHMALKNIPYLFLPAYVFCQVSGVRFQVPAPLFIIPDT